MENKDFKELFNKKFDIAEPTIGHFDRFENRLSKQQKTYNPKSWRWLVMAASIALLFGFWFTQTQNNETLQLADVSPEMAETQNYFSSVLKTEIEKINTQKSPENKTLIDDAFLRLENLEKQYAHLTDELKESDSDKRVVFAMISNFQQRIEILQNLLIQLEDIKQFKTTTDEIYS
ncbi:MAG: hypothetical protein COA67_08160 [Lutibacter sp.]|nr:MAG: hypothetical protein COA67_08160 [Lutibacter sp.]